MLPSFVFDSALSMAAIVARESITAAAARRRMEEVLAFRQVTESQVRRPRGPRPATAARGPQ